jgi:hypothetical protein
MQENTITATRTKQTRSKGVPYKNIDALTPEEVIKQYGGMITSLIKSLNVPPNLIHDAYQEGYTIILEAINTYDKTKASFSTYAYWKLRKYLFNWLYKECYPYGLHAKAYYNLCKADKGITTLSIEGDKIQVSQPITNEYTEINYLDAFDSKAITLFCQKLNHKYDSITCKVIIDYYLNRLKYKELKTKYGNIIRKIRKLDLEPIFKEIRQELNETDVEGEICI